MIDLSNYPSPIAVSFTEAELTENIQLRFRAMLNSFAVTMKYCALVTINNYLDAREKNLFRSDEIDRLFVEKIERPSMGHWNHLMRQILLEMGTQKKELLFMPELYDFYFSLNKAGNPGENKIVRILEYLIFLRNQYVHSDIYPPENEAARLASDARKMLLKLLESLSFLAKYTLIRFLHNEEREERCTGISPTEPAGEQCITFFIKKNIDQAPDKLKLGSFMYSSMKDLDETRYVLLYEGFVGKRIKYVLGNYYLIIEDVAGDEFNPVYEIRSVIEVLAMAFRDRVKKAQQLNIERLKETIIKGNISWNVFRELSNRISDTTYNRLLREGKFSFDLYTERKKINEEVAAFIDSTKSGMIIVADSGLGKTNLFCRLERKLLKESHSVFLLYGRDYNGLPVQDFIMHAIQLNDIFFKHTFKEGFFELLSHLSETDEIKKEHKKVVLLFDAINEYSHPETLLDNIIRFINSLNYPWLKIILSIRTFIWKSLSGKYIFDKELFYYSKDKFGETIHYCTLEKFSEEEMKAAFNQYKIRFNLKNRFDDIDIRSRSALSNPLLLRFASEAYQGEAIPNQLFTSKIFDQYKKERINERDYHFLDYISEAMIFLKNDVLEIRRLFDSNDSQTVQESPLRIPSKIGGHEEILSQKIIQYVFAEQVYESDQIWVCTNEHCRNFNKMDVMEYSVLLSEGSSLSCPVCDFALGTRQVDLRSTYYRLQEENLIQEFIVNGDKAIRFTYDRFFEYFTGEYLEKYTFSEFPSQRGDLLYRVVKEVVKEYIFWGAIKNVLINCFKRDIYSPEFWLQVASYEGPAVKGAETGQVLAAYDEVLAAAIVDYYSENPGKAMEILLYITSRKNMNARTIELALNCMISILAENSKLPIDSSEFLILKRGLGFPDDTVGMEAARIVAAQYDVNEKVVVDFFAYLRDAIITYIKLSNLPLLISPARQTGMKSTMGSLLNLLLYTLGPHYSDSENKETLLRYCGQILSQRVIMLGKRQVINIISKKLADAYWNKGYPCNYLEIYLCAKTDFKQACQFIGNLFMDAENQRLLNYKDEILRYSQINNGLISWYLYSLIPVYGMMDNQREEILEFIRELYEKGNHISRYIAQKSLWILAEHADIKGGTHISMFEEYSRMLIQDFGHSVDYHHATNMDSTIERFLDTCDSEGNSRRHWATVREGLFIMRYDNSAVNDLANYQVRHTNISRLDFILQLLEERQGTDDGFLPYIVMTLGRVGSVQNPAPALMTLQVIMEKYMSDEVAIVFEGKETSLKKAMVNSLLNIKAFYPTQVNFFIENLEPHLQHKFREVKLAEVKNRTDQLVSYYGESIYQKTFLYEKEARNIFGKGIIEATKATTAESLFRSYVTEFWAWFDVIRKDL